MLRKVAIVNILVPSKLHLPSTLCLRRLLLHAASLNPLKLLAHASFLNLTLLAVLRVFKVATVTKLHQVSRLIHFTLKATNGTLNGFAITDLDLDLDSKFGTARGGRCIQHKNVRQLYIKNRK